jgi:outer membrane protein assembly factor BamB
MTWCRLLESLSIHINEPYVLETPLMNRRRWTIVLISILLPTMALADNWNQWRGPSHNGATTGQVNTTNGLLKTAWKMDVGTGYAVPSVAHGRLLILGYKNGEDTVQALDAKSSKQAWQFSYKAKNFNSQNLGGTAATLCVVSGRVLTRSRDGQFHCFEEQSGKLLWKRNVAADFKVKPPAFGFSGSPVTIGKSVFLDMGVLAAFDLDSGRTLWQSKDYGASDSSPTTPANRENSKKSKKKKRFF